MTPYFHCLLTTDKMEMPILITGPLVGEVFGRHLSNMYKTSTFDFMDLFFVGLTIAGTFVVTYTDASMRNSFVELVLARCQLTS